MFGPMVHDIRRGTSRMTPLPPTRTRLEGRARTTAKADAIRASNAGRFNRRRRRRRLCRLPLRNPPLPETAAIAAVLLPTAAIRRGPSTPQQ